ncbi:phospholipase D family protein [Herbaspirillum chlorophenolicum]|uniref:phospholipase D family nuclease n=1 Tax=Herbaspirillum chlorophenolicum TaxID=211589 RepID=UPI000A9B5346|nr:phospholipase D family protein [Herbaspirillum chlorophenolicum]
MNSTMKKALFAISLIAAANACAMPPEPVPGSKPGVEGPQIESAFSPEAGGEELVLKVIGSARKELLLAAYSFSSLKIATALVSAEKRGVDVRMVVDDKRNRGKSSIAALSFLANAGIPVRTNSAYALHHDKYIVVDSRHVQNGSFNYTAGAAEANSENVLVIWNDAELAASFAKHWHVRWDQGSAFIPKY